MISHDRKNNTTTITCDKCKKTSMSDSALYNEDFYQQGWALHHGRKYMHLCNECLSPNSRKAMQFVKEKFGL